MSLRFGRKTTTNKNKGIIICLACLALYLVEPWHFDLYLTGVETIGRISKCEMNSDGWSVKTVKYQDGNGNFFTKKSALSGGGCVINSEEVVYYSFKNPSKAVILNMSARLVGFLVLLTIAILVIFFPDLGEESH